MGMIFFLFCKQQYHGKQTLGVRVTVGESHIKKQNNRWPITNSLGSPAFRRRMCGFEYNGFSIPNSFLCCGYYLTNTSPSSNSKELKMYKLVWYLYCIYMIYAQETWYKPSAAKFLMASYDREPNQQPAKILILLSVAKSPRVTTIVTQTNMPTDIDRPDQPDRPTSSPDL